VIILLLVAVVAVFMVVVVVVVVVVIVVVIPHTCREKALVLATRRTRSILRAQTSAERQHNRIAE